MLMPVSGEQPSPVSPLPPDPLPPVDAPPSPSGTSPDPHPASPPITPDDPVPFLWLMDTHSSIIDHTVQATWGVTTLSVVATFLHDPSNCNMGALLPWASAYGSPARFHLHHASTTRPPGTSSALPLELLAGDYGLKARSASGIRGEDVDDWPCLSDPDDLALLHSHITRLGALPFLSTDAQALINGGLSAANSLTTPPFQARAALLALGDPRLPYSIFEPHSPQQDGHTGLLPLRFTGDPRLPLTRDHPWTDLLLLGSDPNFAILDPMRGLSPLPVLNPPRMGERIRWALHSLCQATLEAVAAPLPRLCRPPRRPVPPPTAAPSTPPPDPDGPPDPPPSPPPPAPSSSLPGVPRGPSDSPHSPPLHAGLPTTSPWPRRSVPSSYGTLWSSLHCGPNHVALAGYTTPLTPNLRVGSLNTNGLNQPKLTELLWYMRLEQLDVFFLLDTRTTQRAGKFLGRQARSFLGPGSVALVSPARPAQGGGPPSRQALVGGQLMLIGPRWGCALKSSHKDTTGLGVLTEAVLGCAGGDILLLGTYFPCPSPVGTLAPAFSNKLWDKLQQWLHQHHIPDSPVQYLKDLVALKTLRHCSRSTANTAPIAIVGGDFNATWSDHLGPLKALGGWASAASLLSPIAQASTDGPEPLFSYYQGATPKSLIDHILLSSSCQGHIAYAGVGCGSFFSSISDHRPVILGLHLHNSQPSMSLGRQATGPSRRAVDLDLTQPNQVAAYRTYTESLLPSLSSTDSPGDASIALRSLCLDSATWLQEQGQRKASRSSGRRHYDGWSPAAMALKAQLVALYRISGHLHGYRGHPVWHSQSRMDSALPSILAAWEGTVRRLTWPTPAEAGIWLDCSGYSPSFWRCATLAEIRRPGFCADLIRKVKRRLHGRFRTDLRRQISAATRARETLREQGKLKRVIASILQKDTELYALHSLQLDQGMLTDAPTLHNMVTEHFTAWYQAPGPTTDWPQLLRDQAAFHEHAAAKHIPQDLSHQLWQAFTAPLQLTALQQELQRALRDPPSLAEFTAAIHSHKGSTAPGATGLTYNMVKGWSPPVIQKVHELLCCSVATLKPGNPQYSGA